MTPFRAVLAALLVGLLATGCESGGQITEPGAADSARYRVTFTSTWSAATHPDDFPPGPHYSGLIGATHNGLTAFWGPQAFATPGIESMAETGSKTQLSAEITVALQNGSAGSLLSGGGIGVSPGQVSLDFIATTAHSKVTLVSMLAPSPDWFVGVNSLDLKPGNLWADSVTVTLYTYDAGTDSGPTYTSPDMDTQPRERIRRIESAPFRVNGFVRPVGDFTFIRK